MNAHFALSADAAPTAIATSTRELFFLDLCEDRSSLTVEGILSLREAADELQAYAKLSGLLDTIGQDDVQAFMNAAFAALPGEDDEEAFRIYQGAKEIVRRWEQAHAHDRPPERAPAAKARAIERPDPKPRPTAKPYCPPDATIQAFWYVVDLCNPEQLRLWLDNHPQDARFLLKLLEEK